MNVFTSPETESKRGDVLHFLGVKIKILLGVNLMFPLHDRLTKKVVTQNYFLQFQHLIFFIAFELTDTKTSSIFQGYIS